MALASTPLLAVGCHSWLSNNCPDQPQQEVTVSIASLQDAGAADDAGAGDGGLAELCMLAIVDGRIDKCEEVSSSGQPAVHVVYTPFCLGGRRPAGLADATPARATRVGAWLARVAHLEAASV
ncbi:MAG TPA: hypothetical protein VHL80_01445, partial [Polyangia bacterium]|nr:hypothetical protein [Polyangia bacterium]